MSAAHRIDPVTQQIVGNALASIADEMATTIFRTAHSTVVRDGMDFSAALCDPSGETVAQAVTVPFHLGSVPHAMETLLAKWGDALRPGDVFVMNDPFDGGIHLQDIFVFKPVFLDEALIGFATTTAHHGDVGGRLPGSAACDNTEIFQEGIRLPWLRLYDRGEPVEAIFEVIRANVRIPRMTLGDLAAQVAATSVAERALAGARRRYGADAARRADERPDRPQRAARAAGDRRLARRHRDLHRLPRLGRDRAARRADHGDGHDRRRRDHRRPHRVGADGAGRAEQHALVHPGVRLPGGPLGASASRSRTPRARSGRSTC